MKPVAAFFVLSLFGASRAEAGGIRPTECGKEGGRPNVWERASTHGLRAYCDRIAESATKLAGERPDPKLALELADRADKLLPGRAAPLVLRARALAALGDPPGVLAALKAAREREASATDEPFALAVFARALAATEQRVEARQAYRRLLPRAALLPSAERGSVTFEAGLLAMAEGPEALDEAIELFRQAVRESQDALRSASTEALALALDRAGRAEEGRATLETANPNGLEAIADEPVVKRALAFVRAEPEALAFTAIVLERSDPALAKRRWLDYAKAVGESGLWLAHAQAKATLRRPEPKKAKP